VSSDITRDMLFLSARRSHGASQRHGFVFRKDSDPYRLKLPINWEMDPFGDRNWRFNLHALRMLDPALDKHIDTGNPKLLRFALRWIMDWRRAHLEGHDSEFARHDMACGLRAARIAYVHEQARLGAFPVKRHEVAKLRRLLREHADQLSDRDFLSYNNHALFQIVGLYAAGLALGGDQEHQARETARDFLKQCLATWFTAEAVHKEHSPEYHAFIARELRRLPPALHTPTLDALLNQADRITDSFVGFDGHLYEIGDTTARATARGPGAGVPVTLAGVKTDLLDLHRSGYVLVRSQRESLITYAAAHSLVHKHADDLAFIWSDVNGPFFIDAGKYGYDKDERRRFFTSARAHNTVSLEGLLIGPETLEAPETGTGFTTLDCGPARGLILSGAADRPGLFRHERTLTFRPGQLIEIEDRVRTRTWRAAESVLNLDGAVTLERTGKNTITATRGGTTVEISWTGGRLTRYTGSTDPEYGWRSRRYKQDAPCHALVLRRTRPQVRLKWRLEISQA